ncbi:MAG TPA: hypothetical protein VKR53_06725 [Puia sp.]|nr:hypothetical protein [Puia sp.]
MKKPFLSIALMLILGTGCALAKDNGGISKSVETAFYQNFKTASNVQWQQKKNFCKVTFTLNDQVMFAYYDPSGRLLAVSKNISSENLPINLQADLKNSYSNYWITDLFENDAHDETSYFVTLENTDHQLILQSNNARDWRIYQKIRKDAE